MSIPGFLDVNNTLEHQIPNKAFSVHRNFPKTTSPLSGIDLYLLIKSERLSHTKRNDEDRFEGQPIAKAQTHRQK